jgi:hypothetical protein
MFRVVRNGKVVRSSTYQYASKTIEHHAYSFADRQPLKEMFRNTLGMTNQSVTQLHRRKPLCQELCFISKASKPRVILVIDRHPCDPANTQTLNVRSKIFEESQIQSAE